MFQAPDKGFTTLINEKRLITNDKINFNGAYHKIEKEDYNHGTDYENGKPTRYVDTPYLGSPVFFFKNGIVGFEYALILDSSYFLQGLKKYGTGEKAYAYKWGVYQIKDDTIKAIIYITYLGRFLHGTTQLLQSNFEGHLQNKDTIIGWHLVPPYPPLAMSINENYFKFLSTSRNLYFKKVPIEGLIDPDKVWINKYRKK